MLFILFLIFVLPKIKLKKEAKIEAEEKKAKDPKRASQMKKLWTIAQTSIKERKPLRAEKALLTILKFDEKNAAAYNRLGILYAKEQKYDEAIECFEIAQSLDSNPSSLHNVGLIYLETGAYEKAAMAFKQALELEGDLPSRHIALAKAQEKLGKRKEAIASLESAYELDPSISTLRQILALHEAAGDTEAIAATTARIEAQLAKKAQKVKAKKTKPVKTRRTMTMRKAPGRATLTKKPVKKRPSSADHPAISKHRKKVM